MYCSKCGNLSDNSSFCDKCGASFTTSVAVPVQNSTSYKDSSTKYKIIIIVLLVILLAMLVILLFFKKNNSDSDSPLTGGSRTVMIYASPTNLESDVRSMTTDLETLSGEKVDLENVNILLYTGGTKYWHNFIDNDENAIYILKEDGFEKLESYEKKNMSDPDTLSQFLNYAYDNYKTDLYDLIIYDHGNAIQGAVVDDFYENDILSLDEFAEALEDSPFNEKNKMELVLFRTCLMGSAEVALTFSPYANYLIGSEEVTWLGSYVSVLDFLNDVEKSDNAIDFGKKYIASYDNFMEMADPFGEKINCYSILDLSKIDEVFDELDNFVDKIDLKESFSYISRERSLLYEFGSTSGVEYLDTVDLYDFVDSISKYSTYDADNLLNAIDEAVVYNNTNIDGANGISIFAPYDTMKNFATTYLSVYNDFEYGSKYKSFMNRFYSMKDGGASSALTSAVVANSDFEVSGNEFQLQLTEEQAAEFAKAKYIVFRKMNEDYYMPVFVSSNATLNENGVLQTNITNKIIRIKNLYDDNNKEVLDAYLQVVDVSNGSKEKYETYGTISYFKDDFDIRAVTYTFVNDNGVPKLSSIIQKSDEQPEGVIIDDSKFNSYQLMTFWYKVFDENGNFTQDWGSYSTYYGYEEKVGELEVEFTSLSGTGEYYCVFNVTDIYGNSSYSKAIKLDLK